MPNSSLIGYAVPASIVLFVLGCGGCGQAVLRMAVPKEHVNTAQVPPFSDRIRYWGDRNDSALFDELVRTAREHPPTADPQDENGPGWGGLALSGGGDCGAFGAGLLCGLTDRGERPRFRVVTGVSTGALIAPLAFLGSRYDTQLRQAYTTVSAKDIMARRAFLDLLRFDSLADSAPLQTYCVRLVTDQMLREVAQEHAKGRRLYIQTVNLDAQRPVVWDMGAIAGLGTPEAYQLFRQIMVASAAIPGVFPPQYIRVEANGRQYDEMHVDGGTVSQMLLNTLPIDLSALHREMDAATPEPLRRRPRVFVIRNGFVRPEWEQIVPKIFPIAGRAISTMIKSQAEAELDLMYYKAKDAQMDFYLCYIPDDYERQAQDEFNTEEMNRMFTRAYELARHGSPWSQTPPRFQKAQISSRTR